VTGSSENLTDLIEADEIDFLKLLLEFRKVFDQHVRGKVVQHHGAIHVFSSPF